MIKPWRITIDTNPDECNLNCIMCDTHSIYNDGTKPNRKFMSKELLEKSIDEAIDLEVKEIIPTTMGEPLMYKYFDTFITKLAGSNVKLNLTTNGTFPNIGVEDWARKLLPILSDIKISINSIDSNINEKIMVKDNTKKKLIDIIQFCKIRDNLKFDVSITLQVTFLNSNLDYLEDVIKFAIENKIDRVKGHQLWITYAEIESESLENSTDKVIKWNNFIDKINIYRDKVKLVNFEKLEHNRATNGVPKSYNCPFLKDELWIDYNGDFNICCAPSEKRSSLGIWGNIKERSILDMFNSKEYLDLVDNYKEQKICTSCSLRRVCD